MKLHVVQKEIGNLNLTPFLDDAATAGTDLICFGELAATGCLYTTRRPPSLETWLELLETYDLRIMLGLPLKQGDALFNTYLYHHCGKHKIYRKINLFPPMNEDRIYSPGSQPGIWQTDLGKFGVAICYDIRFPDLFADLKRLGAEIIFVPAAFPGPRVNDWRRLLIERAKETRLPVVGINAVGNDGQNEFGGCSMVVNADGQVLAEADRTSETVLELDL